MYSTSDATARALADATRKPNLHDQHYNTALMWACEQVKVEVAGILLNKGADIRAENKDGDTALSLSARSLRSIIQQAAEAFQVLVKHGANVNAELTNGETPLANSSMPRKIRSPLGSSLSINSSNGSNVLLIPLASK